MDEIGETITFGVQEKLNLKADFDREPNRELYVHYTAEEESKKTNTDYWEAFK